jgi:hypothetical protein
MQRDGCQPDKLAAARMVGGGDFERPLAELCGGFGVGRDESFRCVKQRCHGDVVARLRARGELRGDFDG